MTERKILQDAKKCGELMWQLEVNRDQEIIDGLKPREVEEYPDTEIISEVEYVLSTYYEGGHHHQIALSGEGIGDGIRLAALDNPLVDVFPGGRTGLNARVQAERRAEHLRRDIEEQKDARAEVRRLKNILKKYKKELAL